MIHELKSDPQNFIDVLRDEKLAEIRLDDREYEEGDYIHLRQTQHSGAEMNKYAPDSNSHLNKPLIYTGREELLKILHVHRGIGMAKAGNNLHEYVALSFKRLA